MKLSRLSIGLVALGACTWVQAQSSVQVFGLLDTNFSRFSSSGSGSVNKLGTDGNSSTRLGFRGVEDLGNGLKASFWLEAAVNPDDGTGGSTSVNNQASTSGGLTFGRRSTVSLQGNWGELRLGRDYVPGFWNLSNYSAFGTNGVGSASFLFYPVPGSARITNVRASNSIGYHLPKMGGLFGQVMYAMGENASSAGATKDDGRVMGLRVGYETGPFSVAFGTTKTKISALGDLTQTNIGGSYDLGVAKLMALWGENKTGDNKTRIASLGARIPLGSGHIRATVGKVKADGVGNDASHMAVGYVYDLSKRSVLYAHYGRISNKDGGKNFNLGLAVSDAGGSSTGYEFGIRHSF